MGLGEPRKGWLRIVNWRPLQKYQKPNPPWIKLYTSLFNDDGPDSKWRARDRWQGLGAGGQSLLVNLWLFVATGTTDGRFWSDPDFLTGILPTDAPIDLAPLIEAGFLEWVDGETKKSKAEGEGEGETEEETEQSPPPPQAAEAEKKERERKSGSASRTADEEQRAQPDRQARQSTGQSQVERECQSQVRSESTGDARPVRVIGNSSPPSGIRFDPPRSDGGGSLPPRLDSPPKAPPVRRGDASLLGKSLPQTLRMAGDPVKYAFLGDLYGRLKFPYAMDSHLGRQEIGAFESLYEDLMSSGLPQSAKMEILAHGLDEADRIAGKKRNRRKGAVWCHVHNQRVQTYLARAGPGR